MPRDNAGAYTVPVTLTPNTTARAADVNSNFNDLGSEIADSLSRSGKGGMSAALAMGGFKISGLANGTLSTDAAAVGQIAALVGVADLAMGAHKITGLANGTVATDAAAFGQLPPQPIAGAIIQSKIGIYTGLDAVTSVIALDDSIPQITEGGEYATLTITPTVGTNIIRVSGMVTGGVSAADQGIVGAIFRDAVANALTVGVQQVNTVVLGAVTFPIPPADFIPGATTAITVRLRIGPRTAGTVYVNGNNAGTRVFGGASRCVVMAQEIKV